MMRPHLRYLSYVLRHKWYVFLAACKLGIPWRGITHDLSKFRPSEWFPYVDSFYGGPWPTRDSVHGDQRNWTRTKEDVRAAFDYAWLLHQKRSRHHWGWWVLTNDTDGVYPLPMGDSDRREMLADWIGAGRAQGKPDTRAWYLANRHKMQLHRDTWCWVEEQLGITRTESAPA